MPRDFSKCTSDICMSGNLGFNNGKALDKCIFAAEVCLPQHSLYHYSKIRGRVTDSEWSSHFSRHFCKLHPRLYFQDFFKVCHATAAGKCMVQLATHSHHLSPDQIEKRFAWELIQGKQQKLLFSWISPLIWLTM